MRGDRGAERSHRRSGLHRRGAPSRRRSTRSRRPCCAALEARRGDAARDARGARRHQALRPGRGASAASRFAVREGEIVGLPRAERRRQDHHHAHPGRHLPAHRRARCAWPATTRSASRSPAGAPSGYFPEHAPHYPELERARLPPLRGAREAAAARDARRGGRPRARRLRARGGGAPACRHALEGLPPARRPGAGAVRRPADPDPRRAHHRPRPGAGGRDPRPGARAARHAGPCSSRATSSPRSRRCASAWS